MGRWFALWALCVAGCVPALTEGVYGCTDDECPTGWFCHFDNLCRSAPPADLEPCESDAQCPGGACNLGGHRRWPVGYCSRSCSSTDDGRCGGLSSVGFAICNDLEDVCVIACGADDTSCPAGLICVAREVRDSPADSVYAECFPASAPIPPGGTCGTTSDCSDPDLECVDGWCTRACSTDAGAELPCPEGETCQVDDEFGEICVGTS